MLNNFGMCKAMGMTIISVANGSSSFSVIAPIKGQIGIALYAGSTGIEIAGAGASYGPQSFTLIGGVTQTLTFMNSNGSSLQLVANGQGLPVFNTILSPMCFAGAPWLWLSSSATGQTLRIAYLLNDDFLNQ